MLYQYVHETSNRPCPACEIRALNIDARQVQILKMVSHGMDTNEIAAELHYKPVTIKRDLKIVFRRLGARNRAHAVAEALRLGVI